MKIVIKKIGLVFAVLLISFAAGIYPVNGYVAEQHFPVGFFQKLRYFIDHYFKNSNTPLSTLHPNKTVVSTSTLPTQHDSTTVTEKKSVGIFCLMPGNRLDQPINLEAPQYAPSWSNSFATGVALRSVWNTIEAKKGVYDWSHFDQGLALARANGKQISLSVSAGIYSPDWLFDENVSYLNLNIKTSFAAAQQTRMPLPWDQLYQNEWNSFIKEFANRYDGIPEISYIGIGGLGVAFETYITQDAQSVTDFNNAGGLEAWKKGTKAIIDMYGTYFKKTPFILVIGEPIKNNEGENAVADVVAYGVKKYPGRFGIRNDGLDAVSTTHFYRNALIDQYSSTAPVGFQMVWSTNGANVKQIKGTLDQAIMNGFNLGGHFIEVYQEDCAKNQYQAMLKTYNQKLIEKF